MPKSKTKQTRSSTLSPAKAKEILKDGTVHGKPLTAKQKRFMGARAGAGK